jgi:hypothetical protein
MFMKNRYQYVLKLYLILALILVMVQVGMAPGALCMSSPIIINDPNEPAVVDGRDFKMLTLSSGLKNLLAKVTFYAAPTFNEFFFYMDTMTNPGAEILIKCHPKDFVIYKQSKLGTGYYDLKLYTGTAGISGNKYSLNIPWTYIGAKTFGVWLYDMTSKDRLPDTGSITVKDERITVNDPNEPAAVDGRDFKTLTLLSGATSLEAMITDYAAPSFNEFFFYMDTLTNPGAEILIKCHPKDFVVYKQSKLGTGYYNLKLYTGITVTSGNNYILRIPWTYIGVNKFTVWLYDMTSKDRLPDTGNIPVTK